MIKGLRVRTASNVVVSLMDRGRAMGRVVDITRNQEGKKKAGAHVINVSPKMSARLFEGLMECFSGLGFISCL